MNKINTWIIHGSQNPYKTMCFCFLHTNSPFIHEVGFGYISFSFGFIYHLHTFFRSPQTASAEYLTEAINFQYGRADTLEEPFPRRYLLASVSLKKSVWDVEAYILREKAGIPFIQNVLLDILGWSKNYRRKKLSWKALRSNGNLIDKGRW